MRGENDEVKRIKRAEGTELERVNASLLIESAQVFSEFFSSLLSLEASLADAKKESLQELQ